MNYGPPYQPELPLDWGDQKEQTVPMSTDPDPRMEEPWPTDEDIEALDPANERPEQYWFDTEWWQGDPDR